MARQDIEVRVRRVAEQALAEQHYVRPVDVLLGLGWLAPTHVDEWRQGRVDFLEGVTQGNLSKISTAMAEFRRWARARGLQPSETAYLARTRDRRALRFSASNDPGIEQAYRTHWISPELSERKRDRLAERQSRPPDLLVIAASKPWTCAGCMAEFETGDLLMMEDPGPHCMDCVDLDHLEFLPAGNTTLTRRAKKSSRLSAVVVRWSRSRKRYERQGVLVEEQALARAEQECLSDAEARRLSRERAAERREELDAEYVEAFARQIGEWFPRCPVGEQRTIAEHACQMYSGRVGRSATAKQLEVQAVELAVRAHIRRVHTRYDELLVRGCRVKKLARSSPKP